jgi:CRISPR/Cas system-associated endonuclease Cas1
MHDKMLNWKIFLSDKCQLSSMLFNASITNLIFIVWCNNKGYFHYINFESFCQQVQLTL